MNSLEQFQHVLAARTPAPPLFPKQIHNAELSQQITASDLSDTIRSGLLLWNDDLTASHDLSQNIETSTGSFWHAIMHRREGDAGNSQYWWRRVGTHPAFALIYAEACKYLQSQTNPQAQQFLSKMQKNSVWNPVDFVLACDRAQGDDSWLRELQKIEMQTLLVWCRDNS